MLPSVTALKTIAWGLVVLAGLMRIPEAKKAILNT